MRCKEDIRANWVASLWFKMEDRDFDGKVVLVTGASSGIGKSTAIAFAGRGARVIVTARRKQLLGKVVDAIGKIGAKASAVALDLSDDADVERGIEEALGKYGRLDVLVNAAGILTSGSIENTALEDWDRTMAVNLRAVFNMMRLAVPHLIKSKGNIVNVSSVNGLRAFPNVLAYNVSKAGVDQLTHCAALELASKGVRVNAVNPGVVMTNLHRAGGMDAKTYADFMERSKTTHPIGRVGRPEEIAELIVFLSSPRASWITGASYSIDGGRAQTCAR